MIGLAFTQEQFQTLLRMVYIANTIANGHRDTVMREFDDLEQYIFSRASKAGLPAATEHHKMAGEEHHHPSVLFENDTEVNRLLDEYDAHILFELLAEKLAERDLERQFGATLRPQVSEKDFMELLTSLADAYDTEFSTNGLAHVIVKGVTKEVDK